MAKSTLLLIGILGLLVVASGYNFFYRPFAEQKAIQVVASPQPSPSVTTVEMAISKLSSREKIAQLIAYPLVINDQVLADIENGSASGQLAQVQAFHPGLVTIFGKNITYDNAQKVIAATQATTLFESQLKSAQPLGIQPWYLRPLIAVDHEGGTVQRFSGTGFTQVPSWQELCSQDENVQQVVQLTSSKELSEVGVNIVFGPVVDLAENNPILKTRICSGSVETVIRRAVVAIETYKQAGIVPVIKHFPGIGSTTKDLHFQFDQVTVTTDEATIYRGILDQQSTVGVMVSHAGVTNQVADLPCSLSWSCVNQLAQYYPQTLILSDDLVMDAAGFVGESQRDKVKGETRSLDQRAYEAVLAGNHVLVFGPGVTSSDLVKVVDRLEAEYNRDTAARKNIDAAVMRLWQVKEHLHSQR